MEHQYFRFNLELQKLIIDLPVAKSQDELVNVCGSLTDEEAENLKKENSILLDRNARLIRELFHLDCSTNESQTPSFLLKLLEKWRHKTVCEPDPEYYLCYDCVASFLTYFDADVLTSRKVFNESAVIRHACYRHSKFEDLFGFHQSTLSFDESRIYFRNYVKNRRQVSFSPEMEKRATELRQKHSATNMEKLELEILKFYKKDGNQFIQNICFNEDFYKDEHLTELMEQIVWDFPVNDLDMRYPNYFRSMEANKTNVESPKFDSTLAIKELNQRQEINEELLASVKTDITNLTEGLSTLGHQVSQLSADLKTNADKISSKIDEEKSIAHDAFSKQNRLLEFHLESFTKKLASTKFDIREPLRRFIQAIVWIVGGLTSVILAIGSFHTDNSAGFFVVLLFSLVCLGLTWFFSKVINWIFLR